MSSTTKKLGIWMDHANAHLIEFTAEPEEIKIIESKFTHQARVQRMHEGESNMHIKEQHQQGEYYKKLGEIIKGYSSVLLFGPTDAKAELHNILLADPLFSTIKMDVLPADKMTDNQQRAFVKKHFAVH